MNEAEFQARLRKLELVTQETVANQAVMVNTLREMTDALRETAKFVASLVSSSQKKNNDEAEPVKEKSLG